MSDTRMCLSCGRTRPASEGRETPGEGCSSSDACAWDLTPEEAWQFWRQKYHELRETRPVRLKPLKWAKVAEDEYAASTGFGSYSIERDEDDEMSETPWATWSPIEMIGHFGDISEAKAACQADYERRIMAALEWVVEPDPCLSEAQKLLNWAADSFAAHAKTTRVPDEFEGYTETSEMYRKAALELTAYLCSNHEERKGEQNASA